MPVARLRALTAPQPDAHWYEAARHANQTRNEMLWAADGWYWCDCYSFYRSLFPEGFLQKVGDTEDGKPNVLVLEDTGRCVDVGTDGRGNRLVKRVMHRYTLHDDLDELRRLQDVSIAGNTFMFLSPVSYYGKSRSSRNARFLHAIMIDLDYVGERELANLLHQMERGVIPYANFLVSSGTGLHVVYKLDRPVPLMKRYVAGLQVLKRELTDRVWNEYTSDSDPTKKQFQGIFQGFRMVGTPTKLNGAIGNPKLKQPYVVECFSHDETPSATIPYLMSFVSKLADKKEMDDLDALQALTQEVSGKTPLQEAREKWPDWYERRIANGEPGGGWLYGRSAYDRVLSVITEQGTVSHRYWCIFYLAVMANKCGVPYDELEDDAYGLLERFDALSVEPGNRFTASDVAAALEAYENGSAAGMARRYTKAFCERKAAVTYGETKGHARRADAERLPRDLSLKKARMVRDFNQQVKGRRWNDDGNRDGAPKKAMQVWEAVYWNEDYRWGNRNIAAIAREAGVSRPTVYKWLAVEDWDFKYEVASGLLPEDADLDEVRELRRETEEFEKSFFEDRDVLVLAYIAENPWKSYDEVACEFPYTSEADVADIVARNQVLLSQMKLGIVQ